MSINNKNVYSFKTTENTLRNYRIYGSDKYGANYRIYGNTEISENLFDENSTWNIHSYINTDNTFPYGSGTNCRTYFMKVTGTTTYKINMTSCGDRLKIDYESQKLYSVDNTSTNISLPSISTVVGKNKLRIPPDKKPSKLMIQYKQ